MQRRSVSLFAVILATTVAVGCGSQGAKPQGTDSVGTIEAKAVPPPPVNQTIGIPDTTIDEFTAQVCVGCHGAAAPVPPPFTGNYPPCTDATQRCPQIADRHHQLVNPPDNFACTTCHNVGSGPGGVTVLVDCIVCHGQQTNPATGLPLSPHHVTAQARAAHCADCHGSLVQNYDAPNRYVPSGPASSFTPRPQNCDRCHQAGTEGGIQVRSNIVNHHGTGIGFGIEGTSCLWCHDTAAGTLNIRTCENCHSALSLHGIMGANAPSGQPGYGHIGAQADCLGCHQTLVSTAASALAPQPTVPMIDNVEFEHAPRTGVATLIRVTGKQFVNSAPAPEGEKTFASLVALTRTDAAGNIDMSTVRVLESAELTESSVLARIPADMAVGNWELRLAKDPLGPMQTLSNKVSITVHPTVAISAAQAVGDTVTISGTGFGPQPDASLTAQPGDAPEVGKIGVAVNGEICKVLAWKDSEVKASCASAPAGATVHVAGVNNVRAPVSASIR